MLKFPVLSFLVLLLPLIANASMTTVEAVYDIWNEENLGSLRYSSNLDPSIPLILKKMTGRPYWDTHSNQHSEEDIQNLLEIKWDSQRTGKTFLDHKREVYRSYVFNQKSFRYELPYPVLYGWWGLNHPPIKKLDGPLGNYHPHFKSSKSKADHAFYGQDFQKKIDALTSTELTFDNELQLIANHNSFLKKLELIQGSKERIWITVMTFSCDDSSSQLLDALVEKKNQGVDVKLMVEGLWTKLILNKCLKLMRKRGIDVMTLFESIKPKTFSHLTHSKFWIFDHQEAILGGQNIMDSENMGTGFNEGARDTEVYIKGPIATDLSLTFAQIWQKNRSQKEPSVESELGFYNKRKEDERMAGARGRAHYADVLSHPSRKNQGVCRVLSQDPGSENSTITKTLTEYLRKTEDYLFMTSPKIGYKVGKGFDQYPSGPIFEQIINVAKRNVRVDFVVNGIDSLGGDATIVTRRLTHHARENGRVFVENLSRFLSDFIARTYMQKKQLMAAHVLAELDSDLNVWNYFRFAHQKVHYFDRILVGIGSFNLDKHSARGNRETELFCFDQTLARQIDQMLVLDLANSVPVVAEEK